VNVAGHINSVPAFRSHISNLNVRHDENIPTNKRFP
jgi:hypothetical protein